jgi:hypothetical protein
VIGSDPICVARRALQHRSFQDGRVDSLLKVGRAAALKFLADRKIDRGPDAAAVKSADAEAETLRGKVRSLRAWPQIRRVVVVALVVALYMGAKALAST